MTDRLTDAQICGCSGACGYGAPCAECAAEIAAYRAAEAEAPAEEKAQ